MRTGTLHQSVVIETNPLEHVLCLCDWRRGHDLKSFFIKGYVFSL